MSSTLGLSSLRVMIAGGSPLVASSLRAALAEARALTSTDAALQVASLVTEEAPDVLVASTRVGGRPFSELLPQVLRCAVPVLVVCERSAVDEVPELLLGGASGFLLLDEATVDQLKEAVRATADGGSALHPAVAMTVLRQWRELRSEQARPTLTVKETEVLRAIASGATTKSMARSMGVSARTVESHRSRIYAKLGARGHVQAVALGLELGLLGDDGSETG